MDCMTFIFSLPHALSQTSLFYLDGKKELHILSKDTDIRVNVTGRKWVNCCGQDNFPDGEIFTSPVEDGVNGVITFSYPAIINGNEFEEVRLTVEAGRIKGESFLLTLILLP